MDSLTQGRHAGMGKHKSELEIEVSVHGAGVGRRDVLGICIGARRNPGGRPALQHLGRQMHLSQSRFLGLLAQDWETGGKIRGGLGSEEHMPNIMPNALPYLALMVMV